MPFVCRTHSRVYVHSGDSRRAQLTIELLKRKRKRKRSTRLWMYTYTHSRGTLTLTL